MSKKKRYKSYKQKQRRRAQYILNHVAQQDMQHAVPRLLSWVLSLPRLVRILLAGIFALAITLVTGLMFYLVDDRFLISITGKVTTDLMIPVVVSTILGFVMYFVGWWMIVGFRGDVATVRGGVMWYLGVGLLALSISFIWIIWVIIEL